MKVYSFDNTVLTLRHPALGALTFTGKGLGSVAVSMAGDRTAHDKAADGSVMVSKIRDRSGEMSLQIQQVSDANTTLNNWFNWLEASDASEWARMSGVLNNTTTGDNDSYSGISFKKQADKAFGAQGQMRTWNLMIADVQQN